jgi:hypothetical protein
MLAIAAPSVWVSAQNVAVEARVNAERVGIEDVLELTVEISGQGRGASAPELPTLDGFRVTRPSTSQRVSIVNGEMSATQSFVYQLFPQREGTFTIGAISVTHDGRTYRTEPIKVEVVSGSVLPRRPSGRGSPFDSFDPFGRSSPFSRPDMPEVGPEDVYLTAEVSKPSVFLGEQVLVSYRLFSRYLPLGPEIEDDPPLTGFWVEEIERESDSFERRTIDGKAYVTALLRQRVVFPTRTGTLEIPPLSLSLAFRVGGNDPFDSLFARATRPITIRSKPLELDVKPLPTGGRPRDFDGAVGDYQMQATLNTDEVEAGSPVTLVLELVGEGNLRSVAAPEVSSPPGFRMFDPQTKESYQSVAGALRASKTWEYILVPESGGTKELGPWSFPYFDPSRAEYVTATAGPLLLRVAGAAAATANASDSGASVGSRGEVKLLREDIRFLKAPPERLGGERAEFHKSPLFVLSLVLPVLWNLGLLAHSRRKRKERTHSHLFRSRRAERTARDRLKGAAKLAAAGSRDFYEEAASALYRYVADKSSTSPSGLTPESMGRMLEERRVPEVLRNELRSVLAALEEARFTPGERTPAEMTSLRERAERLIVSLEKQLGRAK